MKKLIEQSYDAIFVGSGAPRGRDLDIPGRREAAKNIHIASTGCRRFPSATPTGSAGA